MLFGAIMLWEVWRYFSHGWIERYFVEPTFHFKYDGFGWVQPWGQTGMRLHFTLLGILAACIALGFCYRIAAPLFFLAFTYVFLLEQSKRYERTRIGPSEARSWSETPSRGASHTWASGIRSPATST